MIPTSLFENEMTITRELFGFPFLILRLCPRDMMNPNSWNKELGSIFKSFLSYCMRMTRCPNQHIGVLIRSDMPWLFIYVIVTLTHAACTNPCIHHLFFFAAGQNLQFLIDDTLILQPYSHILTTDICWSNIINQRYVKLYLYLVFRKYRRHGLRKDEPPWMDAAPGWFSSELINIQVKIYTWSKYTAVNLWKLVTVTRNVYWSNASVLCHIYLIPLQWNGNALSCAGTKFYNVSDSVTLACCIVCRI